MGMNFTTTGAVLVNPYAPGTIASFSCWIRFNQAGRADRIFGGGTNWGVRRLNSEAIRNLFFDNGTNQDSVGTIASNTLTHLVCTANSSTGERSIYINGVLDVTDNLAGGSPGITNTRIGAITGSTTNLDGFMDDVRIYTKILSPAEIATIYAARGTDNIFNGLKSKWLLNELNPGALIGAAGSVKDIVGGFNGSRATAGTTANYGTTQLKYRRVV